MTTSPYQTEPPDWSQVSDITHTVARCRHPRRAVSVFPATPVTQQTSWLDNIDCVARYEIGRLDCGQWANIEGVLVSRTSAHAGLKYRVAGGAVCNMDTAIQQVCQIAREREASESARGSGVRS